MNLRDRPVWQLWGVLLAVSAAITGAFLAIHLPAAMMLGPMISGIVLGANGARLHIPSWLLTICFGIVSCLIARSRGQERVVAHSHVAGTKWTLLVVAPADEIAAEAVGLRNRLQRIGLVMAFALALFYVLFLAFLLFRTRALSSQLAAPLEEIGDAITKIGGGDLDHPAPRSRVIELDAVSRSVVGMARGLSKAYATIAEQQEQLGVALDHERAINSAQRRFIDVVSHELRTPLTMIDTAAQIFQRRAERLEPDAIRERAGNMRRAVARSEAVIASMLQLSAASDSDSDGSFEPRLVDVAEMLRQQANYVHLTHPEQQLDVTQVSAVEMEADPAMLHMALAAIFDNAVRYGGPEAHIGIVAREDDDRCAITVADDGPGC